MVSQGGKHTSGSAEHLQQGGLRGHCTGTIRRKLWALNTNSGEAKERPTPHWCAAPPRHPAPPGAPRPPESCGREE